MAERLKNDPEHASHRILRKPIVTKVRMLYMCVFTVEPSIVVRLCWRGYRLTSL